MLAAITRWFSGGLLTSILGSVGFLAIGGLGLAVLNDIRTAGGAQAKIDAVVAQCHDAEMTAANKALADQADMNHRAALAAQKARDEIASTAADRAARITVLEALLENQPVDEQCGYSPDVTEALRSK